MQALAESYTREVDKLWEFQYCKRLLLNWIRKRTPNKSPRQPNALRANKQSELGPTEFGLQ